MKTKLPMLPVALAAWTMVAGAALADVAQGGGAGGYGYHPHMGGEWGWGGMFLGPLFGILFIAAIAVAIILVIRAIGGGVESRRPRSGGGTALDILDERFARGEIDIQEYEDRKRVLTGE
jgi:putative membrane protein